MNVHGMDEQTAPVVRPETLYRSTTTNPPCILLYDYTNGQRAYEFTSNAQHY